MKLFIRCEINERGAFWVNEYHDEETLRFAIREAKPEETVTVKDVIVRYEPTGVFKAGAYQWVPSKSDLEFDPETPSEWYAPIGWL